MNEINDQNKLNNLQELLEFEINKLSSDTQRHGMTEWALLAAMFYILWILVNKFVNTNLGLSSLMQIAFAGILTADLIKGALAFLVHSKHLQRLNLSNSRFSHMRPWMVLCLFQCLFVIYILWRMPPPMHFFAGLTLKIYYLIAVLLYATCILMSFFKIPIIQSDNLIWKITWFLLFSAFAVSCSAAFFVLGMPLMQFSVLMGGLFFCIHLLARVKSPAPLIETLIAVRRSIGLGEMDYLTACKQTKIALNGLQFGDVVQDEINKILECLRQAGHILDSILLKYNTNIGAIPEYTDVHDVEREAQRARINSAYTVCTDFKKIQVEELEKHVKQASKPLSKIKMKVAMMKNLKIGNTEDFLACFDEIDEEVCECEKRISKINTMDELYRQKMAPFLS